MIGVQSEKRFLPDALVVRPTPRPANYSWATAVNSSRRPRGLSSASLSATPRTQRQRVRATRHAAWRGRHFLPWIPFQARGTRPAAALKFDFGPSDQRLPLPRLVGSYASIFFFPVRLSGSGFAARSSSSRKRGLKIGPPPHSSCVTKIYAPFLAPAKFADDARIAPFSQALPDGSSVSRYTMGGTRPCGGDNVRRPSRVASLSPRHPGRSPSCI